MAANAWFVEWLDPQAKVIQVAGFLSRRCAASSAEFAIDGYEINDRSAGAQLHQTNVVLASLHGAAKRAAVKAQHAVKVDDAQYEMIDFSNTDHGV